MKGTNELHLNEATVREAIQHWLDSKMATSPKVAGFKKDPSPSMYRNVFVVTLESEEDDNE